MSSHIESERLSNSLAELDQLTNWERRPRGDMRVDLEPMRDLARRLGDPQNSFRIVHLAGTKGKGSTCALIEAGLLRAGFSVGRYASPHVMHITERVSIDGRPVGEERLADALGAALAAFKDARREATDGQRATWFDILTVSALLIFSLEGVEWAVLETGLGGRWDSTNIVQSDVAVITNIDLEHTEILGKTRAAIAFEKAGIIKRGATVVTLLPEADEAGAVVSARAAELGCAVRRPTVPADATIEQRNVALAGAVLDELGKMGVMTKGASAMSEPLGEQLLDPSTIEAARLPGRLEKLAVDITVGGDNAKVNVVLDGAHVPFNLAAVLRDLSQDEKYRAPCIAVMSIADDKDAAGLLSTMTRHDISIIFTTVGARSLSPEQLKTIADTLGLLSIVMLDPLEAYQQALAGATESGAWVLVTGSLYLVGIIRSA
ncbi:bifunctional folylpolyglutamate synthase/dihydrofolate synthase [Rhizobium ruizarguesonis]|uniref:Dihydrofolate synthase/folylpolyglutamate synthase n=1 Tax=Rhizobium ruizarguesonis TaxID=2081791 RepID=A0ABY1X532_9HYPH|nr:Mur ligase family protein [Rhizobium ruizarguesonis]TAU75343.1 bifunctional folylpolyglutamate synthase/dihydrofolate synthase [Rhizobium ruizarguesonis]TAV14756.1 bifunctional folylpolyglutamate synthase/dihydrofolate synthase [Rhizobium ruizarguesonis]TAV27219.1 bifunctional folylpolyglutamate synthase/dihydrofolate synthase [Rhizobium ruizarguesonis]TAV31687.1 bifunctional folylpolyglutamate synthase/dihydrofolate synthase [Rhizobium ruizarguesonis]TAV36448.1 bifunctional folylpolyglutam